MRPAKVQIPMLLMCLAVSGTAAAQTEAPQTPDAATHAPTGLEPEALPASQGNPQAQNPPAAEAAANGEVFFNHGALVLMEDGKVTRYFTPKKLAEHGRFQVRIQRAPQQETKPAPAAAPQPSLAERIEARRLLFEANQAYFAGDTAKSWELVIRAEQLDPTHYRIKTMKGSLLYKIGSADLAREVWNESLAQNPDQPEIVHILSGLKNNAAPAEPSTVAHGTGAKAKDKGSLQ